MADQDVTETLGQAESHEEPFVVTIERLAKWASELDAKGIRLAPASAVANRQTMR